MYAIWSQSCYLYFFFLTSVTKLFEGLEWTCLEDDFVTVKFDAFVAFLRSKLEPCDKFKEIRRFNVDREIQKYNVSLNRSIGAHSSAEVTLEAIVRYCLNHQPDMQICAKISVWVIKQICRGLTGHINCNSETEYSNFSLYNKIVKHGSRPKCSDVYTIQDCGLEEENISTLSAAYKDCFTPSQWFQICLFEYHFLKKYKDEIDELTYEHTLKLKHDFLSQQMHVANFSSLLPKQSSKTIKDRQQRVQAAELEGTIKICNGRHIPSVMEKVLQCLLKDSGCEECVPVCVDCTKTCKNFTNCGIHVFIQINGKTDNSSKENYQKLSEQISKLLLVEHKSECHEVQFFNDNAFTSYMSMGRIVRLELRDAVAMHKLTKFTVYCFQNDNFSEVSPDEEICEKCFHAETCKPLHWETLAVTKAWHLNVPIEVQAFLETFVNTSSIRKSKDKQKFLTEKLKDLYACYDRLLNVFNKNHIGVLQRRNTDELVMNYSSVQTVFSVTSSVGATLSLKEADKSLKERSMSDVAHRSCVSKFESLSKRQSEQSVDELMKTNAFSVEKYGNLQSKHVLNENDSNETQTKAVKSLFHRELTNDLDQLLPDEEKLSVSS